MYYEDTSEAADFIREFSTKSYVDIFNLRSRVERREWERKAIKNIREVVLRDPNPHPRNMNVLYFHVPFCATRCDYCPYFSSLYDKNLVSSYLAALETEVKCMVGSEYVRSTHFDCVYVGGGTPSILHTAEIERLAQMVQRNFSLGQSAELTFESNPSTLTEEKAVALRQAGFNRVSLGIQSFNDRTLRELHCAHTAKRARQVIDRLLELGFTVNIDMIFGLPSQTAADLEEDLRQVSTIAPPHQLTLFPLRIADDTPLRDHLEGGGAVDARAHRRRLLEYDAIAERYLGARSYEREECSVFYHKAGANPHLYHSTETRVLGLGLGAGTILDRCEATNYYDLGEYIDQMSTGRYTSLSGIPLTERQAYERFILYRVLYSYRSRPDFKETVARRFREFYEVDLGAHYDNVLRDMEQRRFMSMKDGVIELSDRLWRILDRVKIGMPSIV